MTPERWLILCFAVLGVAGSTLAGASATQLVGLPLWLPFVGSVVSACSAVALGLLRGWFDASPDVVAAPIGQPQQPPH